MATGTGHVLIDTGGPKSRRELEGALAGAGCQAGGLQLIVLTHGDFDHIGNAAYLRTGFGATIAMHRDDSGMAERGDMFWNRKAGSALIRALAPLLFRFGQANRFVPDLYVEDGLSLAAHGLEATVLSIPGHSKGCIGILTAAGDLFCGDLFDNTKGPALNAIMDDPAAAEASIQKLRNCAIRTVYPGHGRPFAMEQLPFARPAGI